jgi:UDP:flavonoid glycosyltransferase YjiC (YdhE family)
LRRGDELAGWPTRFVPYGGGGPVADPGWRRGSRPRVCVTLGSVAPRTGGLGPLPDLVKACGELPVEIALALGDTAAGALGPLPDNVHQVGWTPLSGLLAGCSAIIHHGGTGTTFNALAAGVPQLALPQFGDQFRNSAAIVQRGVGLAMDHDDVDGPSAKSALGRLLDDPAILAAAAEVRTEMARTQSPVTLPALLAGL